MKILVRTAAVAVAAAGISSSVSPAATLHVGQIEVAPASVPKASVPPGLSFEDLRVGLTGKVSAKVGSVELPMRLAENPGCRTNTDCN